MEARSIMTNHLSQAVLRGLFMLLIGIGCFSNSHFVSPINAQGPENTLVVVNEESPDSLAVANHYIHLRKIPPCNVLYLNGITTIKQYGEESSSSKAFKRQILDPLLKAIKDRGIENQIDCVAYSAGFPTRINFQPEMKTYLQKSGKKYQLSLHAPWASITSLTYFHRNAYSKNPDFLELDANHYANPRRMKVLANPFTGDGATQYSLAIKQINAKDYDAAIESLNGLGRKHPHQLSVVYAFARCLALKGESDKAIAALKYAKSLGFAHRSLLENDKAFSRLKSEQALGKIIEQMEDLPDGMIATRPFSSQYFWGQNGWPTATEDQGDRYLLSSVLAVTGENQSTLAASLDRLESSAGADGTKPNGNVYFADHKDVRSRTRKSQFPFAADELKSLGRSASIGSDIYPMNDKRVIGATLGSPVPKWGKSKSQFLPGAICDNLTSYGGWWEKSGQTQLSEYLDAGAAGASGTVYEPTSIAAKFPSARWHAHYARGCTLAESFYQSVSGPFQLLLVGDPLCCPFATFPDFKIEGLKQNATIDSDFVLQIKQLPGSPKVERFELYFDGVYLAKVSAPNNIVVETSAMHDGYHELRIVGVADSAPRSLASQSIGFVVNRNDHTLDLSIHNRKVRLGNAMMIHADSSLGERVQIRQNSRTIASVESGQPARITAAQIGLGKSRLQAVVVLGDGTLVRSKHVGVEVVQ